MIKYREKLLQKMETWDVRMKNVRENSNSIKIYRYDYIDKRLTHFKYKEKPLIS